MVIVDCATKHRNPSISRRRLILFSSVTTSRENPPSSPLLPFGYLVAPSRPQALRGKTLRSAETLLCRKRPEPFIPRRPVQSQFKSPSPHRRHVIPYAPRAPGQRVWRDFLEPSGGLFKFVWDENRARARARAIMPGKEEHADWELAFLCCLDLSGSLSTVSGEEIVVCHERAGIVVPEASGVSNDFFGGSVRGFGGNGGGGARVTNMRRRRARRDECMARESFYPLRQSMAQCT